MKIKWTRTATSNPPDSGYFLATWKCQRGDKLVSELWYNPTTGWWDSRGYLGQHRSGEPIVNVVAWAPMPAPA
jgi:hypothetical protein